MDLSKQYLPSTSLSRKGERNTLIELLVVIAIIGVLLD